MEIGAVVLFQRGLLADKVDQLNSVGHQVADIKKAGHDFQIGQLHIAVSEKVFQLFHGDVFIVEVHIRSSYVKQFLRVWWS